MIPQDHPFRRYIQYYYLDSGTEQMPIFLFKWNDDHGTLVELVLNDKDSGPRGRAYSVTFVTDKYWELDKNTNNIVRSSISELYNTFCNILDTEALIHGTKSSENS